MFRLLGLALLSVTCFVKLQNSKKNVLLIQARYYPHVLCLEPLNRVENVASLALIKVRCCSASSDAFLWDNWSCQRVRSPLTEFFFCACCRCGLWFALAFARAPRNPCQLRSLCYVWVLAHKFLALCMQNYFTCSFVYVSLRLGPVTFLPRLLTQCHGTDEGNLAPDNWKRKWCISDFVVEKKKDNYCNELDFPCS